jgi:hypothetical protein
MELATVDARLRGCEVHFQSAKRFDTMSCCTNEKQQTHLGFLFVYGSS